MSMENQMEAKPKASFTAVSSGLLQRNCSSCHKKRILQRSALQNKPEIASPIVHEALRSPGKPLDANVRTLMEPRFGHDFSQIPVHSKSPAGIQAKLTVNTSRDIYEQEADRVSHEVMRMPPGAESRYR